MRSDLSASLNHPGFVGGWVVTQRPRLGRLAGPDGTGSRTRRGAACRSRCGDSVEPVGVDHAFSTATSSCSDPFSPLATPRSAPVPPPTAPPTAGQARQRSTESRALRGGSSHCARSDLNAYDRVTPAPILRFATEDLTERNARAQANRMWDQRLLRLDADLRTSARRLPCFGSVGSEHPAEVSGILRPRDYRMFDRRTSPLGSATFPLLDPWRRQCSLDNSGTSPTQINLQCSVHGTAGRWVFSHTAMVDAKSGCRCVSAERRVSW